MRPRSNLRRLSIIPNNRIQSPPRRQLIRFLADEVEVVGELICGEAIARCANEFQQLAGVGDGHGSCRGVEWAADWESIHPERDIGRYGVVDYRLRVVACPYDSPVLHDFCYTQLWFVP